MVTIGPIGQAMLALGAFGALALMLRTSLDRRRVRTPGHGWLVATLLVLSLGSVPIDLLGFRYDVADHAYWWRIFGVVIFLTPAFLARAIRAMTGIGGWMYVVADTIVISSLLWLLLMPTLPGAEYVPRPWHYDLMLVGLVLSICACTLAALQSIRRVGITGGGAARVRANVLVIGLVGWGISFLVWLFLPTPETQLAAALGQLVSGVFLLVGIRGRRRDLGLLLRTPFASTSQFVQRLIAIRDIQRELPALLEQFRREWGLIAIGLVESSGHVVEIVGSCSLHPHAARIGAEAVAHSSPRGLTIVAWTTTMTPPIRPSDHAELGMLATLLQVAIQRESATAVERSIAARSIAATRMLEEANERLREADRMKDHFVALVSHELRTPLTSTTGMARTIQDLWSQLQPAQIQELVAVIVEQGDRLTHLLDDLLLISKIDAGALSTEPARIDVESALQKATVDADVAGRVTMELELESSTIVGDNRAMHEILVNYLSNARKYGREPYEVRCVQHGPELLVEVIDHGDGVRAEFAPRLFERFARDATQRAQGTGLGLSIVSDLAQSVGGEAGHYQGDGKNVFWARLPVTAEGPVATKV